ncbi:LysR family transcriptional regulator [Granulicella sp. dw_53]|uniref:LysR family transcriptional regulator n=1 Tax=Granulicella sp. dw_53 TaxID=2719792 RepID=UPI001BD29C4F|nr:LysR family transcriptional regulator [Granulicella sp. dw_53]
MSTAVEVRFQEAVIALADELNYTRAANRLHITQSALTKQIRELEKYLGFALFERDKRRVALTLAGEEFLREARLAVLHAQRAVHLARAAENGAERVISVGRTPYTDPDLITALFTVELPQYPIVKVHLESGFSLDLVQSVATGRVDFAIATEAGTPRSLTNTPLTSAPLYVALSEDDPRALNATVALQELTDKCWAVFSKTVHPILYERIFEIVSRQRINVKEVQHILTAQEAYPLILEQDCITFLTQSTALRAREDGIVFRPLRDEELVLHTSLFLRADNDSRLVNSFVRSYLRALRNKGSQLQRLA